MIIGVLRFTVQLPGNNSLKGKRKVANSLKQKLRNKFNSSVAEISHQDCHTRLDLALVTISSETQRVESTMHKAMSMVEAIIHDPISDVSTEIFSDSK